MSLHILRGSALGSGRELDSIVSVWSGELVLPWSLVHFWDRVNGMRDDFIWLLCGKNRHTGETNF